MKRLLLLHLLVIMAVLSNVQTIRYFNDDDKELKNDSKASYYLVIEDRNSDWYYPVRRYDKNGVLISEGLYADPGITIRVGTHTWFYPDGTKREISEFRNGLRNGVTIHFDEQGMLLRAIEYNNGLSNGFQRHYWPGTDKLKTLVMVSDDKEQSLTRNWLEDGTLISEVRKHKHLLDGLLQLFWEDGSLKRRDVYAMGVLEAGRCISRDGIDTTWFPYLILPIFNGKSDPEEAASEFSRWIGKNVVYPASASKEGIEGKVLMEFFVNGQGEVINPRVLSPTHPTLNREAIRTLMKSPPWTPGAIEGKPATFRYTVIVNFSLGG
ncbi:MAG: TonB family protein [Bacteroidales bacterium]|nr:TonB family protein [Bacteroidales bacterium]